MPLPQEYEYISDVLPKNESSDSSSGSEYQYASDVKNRTKIPTANNVEATSVIKRLSAFLTLEEGDKDKIRNFYRTSSPKPGEELELTLKTLATPIKFFTVTFRSGKPQYSITPIAKSAGAEVKSAVLALIVLLVLVVLVYYWKKTKMNPELFKKRNQLSRR